MIQNLSYLKKKKKKKERKKKKDGLKFFLQKESNGKKTPIMQNQLKILIVFKADKSGNLYSKLPKTEDESKS